MAEGKGLRPHGELSYLIIWKQQLEESLHLTGDQRNWLKLAEVFAQQSSSGMIWADYDVDLLSKCKRVEKSGKELNAGQHIFRVENFYSKGVSL